MHILESSNQDEPLIMFLYGITLVPLVKELWTEDPEVLLLFHADYSVFDGLEHQSACLLILIPERGASRGYFPDTDNLLFICEFPTQ